MLRNVIIDIKSIHSYDGSDTSDIEFTTEGHYTYDDDVGCITYLESEVTGMEGTRTSVFVMPDQIVVDRDGNVTSRMVFKEGEKNQFLYQTPYGKAVMGIDTRAINQSFGVDGGRAEIDYVVDVEHTVFTKNKFTISVKDVGDTVHA